MATLLGRASAPSAGERKISENDKNRFKKTRLLLRGSSFPLCPMYDGSLKTNTVSFVLLPPSFCALAVVHVHVHLLI